MANELEPETENEAAVARIRGWSVANDSLQVMQQWNRGPNMKCVFSNDERPCTVCSKRKEVWTMSDEKTVSVKLNPPGKELEDAGKNFLDKWAKRYAHTKVGKVLSFFGFGSK